MEKLEQFYELQRQQEQFDRMSVGRQHLGSERAHLEHRSDHYPDEPPYGRPQEPFRHDHGMYYGLVLGGHWYPGSRDVGYGPPKLHVKSKKKLLDMCPASLSLRKMIDMSRVSQR